MANIMINDVCNLMCPYCFANEYVNGDTSTDITYGNFKKAVDWINKSSDMRGEAYRIAFIGGEPLLHHQFEDLITYASVQRRPGQEILVFTNGILADKYVEVFAKNDISLLLNINSYEDIGENRYQKVVENIRLLRMKGVRCSIGINLYKANMNMQFIFDIIEEFSFKELRVGIVSPNTEEKKNRGPFHYFEEIKEPLLNIAEECGKRGCGIHLDCQKIPICLMDEEKTRIRRICDQYRVNVDIVGCSSCVPVLDILTDLQVVRCFGVSGRNISVPMENFVCENDVDTYFQTQIDNIGKLIPVDPRCTGCYERHIGQCQGGCLAYKMDKILHVNNYNKKKD